MRLDRMTPAHVRRALQIYLQHAWPEDRPERPPFSLEAIETATTIEELLARFERPAEEDGPACARYVLRLGNWRYPFMKFVVQEYLVDEEYFFCVDTHDALRIRPEMPDYDQWQLVRAHNRELKDRIEAAWTAAGLPTHENLRRLMEGIATLEREDRKRARILVVDDERDVAEGLAAVLAGRGYGVETAFDGRQALERILRDPLPDLVLLDYSMPELDGEEVMRRVRRDPRCKDLPILLATATSIDLSTLSRASGMLRKPYLREVLFAMIAELLGAREPDRGGGPGPGGADPPPAGCERPPPDL